MSLTIIENVTALHSIVQLVIDAQNHYKCTICLETICDGVKIDCRHTFCFKCLKEYESINSKNHKTLCPICKRMIKRRKKYVDSYMAAFVTFTDELSEKLQSVFDTGIMELGSLDLIKKAIQSKNKLEHSQLDKNKLFDDLLPNTSRSRVRKVYGTPKVTLKYKQLDILPFENEENKSYVQQWLNDNKNMFDRITQTQNDVQNNTDQSVRSDIESVSQVDTKKLSCRSRSLECLNKIQLNPISRSQNIEKIEEFSSEDNNCIIPNTEEKLAIVNLLEDEFLKTVEKEVVTNKSNKKGEGKRKSKKKNTSALLNGWQRMKEMKRMARKHDRRPKKLNITRRQSTSSSDNKNICKELKVMLVDLCDEKNEDEINTPKKSKNKKLSDPEMCSSSSSVFSPKKTIKNIILSGETSSSINCELKTELVVAQIHESSEKKKKNLTEKNLCKNKKPLRKRTRSQIEEENKIVVDANSMEDYFKKNMHFIPKEGNDFDVSELSQDKDSIVYNEITRSSNSKKHIKSQNETSNINKSKSQNSDTIVILNNSNNSTKKNYGTKSDDDDKNEIFLKSTQRICDKNDSKTSDILKVLATNDLLDVRIRNFENFVMCQSNHWKNRDEIVIAIKKLKKLLLQNNENDSCESETVVVKQDQSIQTEINNSPRGICVSSNEIFITINRSDVDVQTDSFTCPNCKNTIEHRANSDITEKIIPNQILTDSFDNVQFETQNLLKKFEKSQSKEADIITKNVSNTQSTSKTKDTMALVIDANSQNESSEKNISRQLDFAKGNSKTNYKRIRTVSDSESDSEEPYNVKRICSKYLRNELQVSLQFETETIQDEIKNQEPRPKTESQEMYEKCMKALLNAEKHSSTNKKVSKKKKLDIVKNKETVFSLNVMQEFQNSEGFTCDKTNENTSNLHATDDKDDGIIMDDLDESIFADVSFDEMIKKNAGRSLETKISESNDLCASSKQNRKVRKSDVEFLMDGVRPLSPNVNILQNIVVKALDEEEEEKEKIDKSQGSVDIIEATPEKKSTSFKKRNIQNKENISNADNENNECLNITLPPPEEFQDDDFNENNIFDTNDMDVTICNKIVPVVHTSSQILSNKAPNLSFSQALSPIAQEKQKRVLSLKMNDKLEFSPLTLVRKTQVSQQNLPLNTSTPRQKSILKYTKPSTIKKPCVACTRLNREQTTAVLSLMNKTLIEYSTDFNPSVTHMIVNVNNYDRNCVKDHTLKFVLAVASGIWVLNFKWIQDCLKQKCIVPEEPYEALDVSGLPGPKESRLNRLKNPLFRNFKIFTAPPFQCTTKHEMETIIISLGGKTIQNVEDFKRKESSEICLIVTEARYTQDFEIYEKWLETFGVLTVDVEWVSRSVGQYKLLSLRPFCLCSDDVNELNYPPELLTDVPFSFSQSTYSTV